MTTILSDLNQFHKFLKSPPHHAYIATQPCKILMSAKQAINDKLQGSVATQARCGGIFNIHSTTNLPSQWKIIEIG